MNVRRLVALVISAAAVAGPVAGAQAAKDDLFLVNRASGAAGAAGDRNAYIPSISADGRYVAFESGADNLSSEDDDTVVDVYVRDLRTRTTTLVSRAKGGSATAAPTRPRSPPTGDSSPSPLWHGTSAATTTTASRTSSCATSRPTRRPW